MPGTIGARRRIRDQCGLSVSAIALGAALGIGGAGGEARAQTVIESSDTGQTLRTDTAYILNFGTTVSDRNSDAITVNGIAPVTFTNAGVVTSGRK